MDKLSGKNLTCVRRQAVIFSALSFSVKEGQILALTGPNGSGKTSLLRIIAGLLPASEGELLWNNTDDESLQDKMHWIGPENPFRPQLTVMENLKFWAAIQGAPDDGETVLTALDKLDIARLAETRTQYLSAGQLRRVSLCRLFLSERPLWLLDEPATALDQKTSETLRSLVKDYVKQKGMAIIATHRPAFWKAEQNLDLKAGAA